MTRPYTGGCVCGAVRYEFAAEPFAMSDCQCRQCQKDSGTGHGSYLTFVNADPQLTGQIACFEITGDGGTVKSRAFCPVCGTQLYISFPAMSGVFAVRAGTLDEPERYSPQFVTWAGSALAWDAILPGIMRYDRMPPQGG